MSYARPVRPARRKRPPMSWKKRVGWAAVVVGLALFLAGNIGAVTGLRILPFDTHHVLSQLGGGLLAVIGLPWAAARERSR